MKKILVICGPTATGKTSIGIDLAKKFNGEIISADSRQVYQGMDIGTGKERSSEVKIWGYDLVSPMDEFSVSDFVNFANPKIGEIYKANKLPIIVGGTGFYIKALTDGFETVGIPKNSDLRLRLEQMTVEQLYEMLSQIDSFKAGQMNHSDRNNPRRLVRAIEISTWLIDNPKQKEKNDLSSSDTLFIGLRADIKTMDSNIDKRVDVRVEQGVVDEIKKLLDLGVSWESQSMQALGYRLWRDYFEGEAPIENILDEWKKEERQYVRRQLTWFIKDKRINWFDIRSENLIQDIENLVNSWHNTV